MFKAERLQKIQELITKQNHMDINTLSKLLNVSNVTVRNDLKELEEKGILYRTHGGATLRSQSPLQSIPLLQDLNPSAEAFAAIERIAEKAANYVEDKEWIFLGSGTTTCAIAKALAGRDVQVVTNNVLASYILSQQPSAIVILCGGKVYTERIPFLSGDLTLNNLSSMFFNKAFIGVSAVDFKCGYSVSNDVECNIFKFLQDYSKEIIVVTDSSKFEKAAFMSIGNLDIATTIISDTGMPECYQEYYKENNINMFLV